MFGHDNHDENQQKDDQKQTGGAPLVEPQADGVLDASHQDTPKDDTTPAGATPLSNAHANEDNSFVLSGAGTNVTSNPTPSAPSEDLLQIKQDALKQLTPLVGHLDQSPEERFRTTMMMIQAADNQALIKDAYDAAQKITDEKARAQALLDVVNEINYFTTQQHAE